MVRQEPITDEWRNLLTGKIPTLSGWNGNPSHVFQDDGGVFTDYTAEAINATEDDVVIIPATEEVNDACYIGDAAATFDHVYMNISQAAVGDAFTVEYWNGSDWTSIAIYITSDESIGLTQSGLKYIKWSTLPNWAKTTINGQNNYWVRIRVLSANFTTTPRATQILIGSFPSNLINITDNNDNTTSLTAAGRRASGGIIGGIIFDLGAKKRVIIGGKVGLFSSANGVALLVSGSEDDVTYTENASVCNYITSTSEKIIEMYGAVTNGRYIKLSLDINGAGIGLVNFYEILMWELK